MSASHRICCSDQDTVLAVAVKSTNLAVTFRRRITICGWQTPMPFLSGLCSLTFRAYLQSLASRHRCPFSPFPSSFPVSNSIWPSKLLQAKKHAGGRPKLVVAAAAAHSQPLFGVPGIALSAKGSLQSPTPTNTSRTVPGSAQAPGTKREYNTRMSPECYSISPASQHCAACQHNH